MVQALAENHDRWSHDDVYKEWRELQRLDAAAKEARRVVQI